MYDIYQQSALGVKKCKVNTILETKKASCRRDPTDSSMR